MCHSFCLAFVLHSVVCSVGVQLCMRQAEAHALLGLGALFTRCWKAESLSLMAVSASSLKAFTCIASRFHSAHLVRAMRTIGGDTSPTIIVSGGCLSGAEMQHR